MSKPLNPWKRLASREVYDNPWIRIREDQVLRPDGKPGIYGAIHFKRLAVGVVPVDEKGWTYLVGQYRYVLDQYFWEIPEGGSDPGEKPEVTARRELEEETGLQAKTLHHLLDMHLSNSVSDELAHCYLATGLSSGLAHPDGTEELEIRHLPLAEAIDMVHNGAITDSLSVASLLKIDLLIQRGTLPAFC